uniref:Uncharacterized protein n=1 Tax=Rhizophora mucronata TaxID=61149 RepID=A0A2P2PU63_RHIMU
MLLKKTSFQVSVFLWTSMSSN